jgi:hypothetical protein
MNRFSYGALTSVILILAGPSVLAHHSFAMFDRDKVERISGTVRQFEWKNPHCYLTVAVISSNGVKEWLIESGGPGSLVRQDPRWRKDIVKPGDMVTVEFHPLKSGEAGGELYDLYTPTGLRIGPHAPGVK